VTVKTSRPEAKASASEAIASKTGDGLNAAKIALRGFTTSSHMFSKFLPQPLGETSQTSGIVGPVLKYQPGQMSELRSSITCASIRTCCVDALPTFTSDNCLDTMGSSFLAGFLN
jgi:hypothetical protein